MREKTAAIWAGGNQGIEHIDRTDNLGHLMDVTTLEPVGIAASVPSFMGLPDDLREPLPLGSELADQLIAQLRMLLDQRPLLMSQSTRLGDHGLGHGKQSDVMHEAGERE